jgi:glyoxylase-like metal-dependent hydrolase (beta-lactamase superfamily II)
MMKLYPLLLGRTKVPYGQFYGGLSGWQGLGTLLRFVTDKSHFIWVPIHAYLLEHPSQGLVLFDAGICSEQAHHHRDYYRGIYRLLFDDDEYAQEPQEDLPVQLQRLGYRVEDVRTVVLTHMHEDHVGNIHHLTDARIVVSKAEWDARGMKLYGFIPITYEPSFSMAKKWGYVDYTSGAYYNFDRSQDLFGDGTVRLLPTPGHTPGHLSAVIQMEGYQLMVTGDIMYTLRHLATRQVQALRFNKKMGDEQLESINRMGVLKNLQPDLFYLPGHDHTDYQWQYIVPKLSKGRLTPEDRREISDYESKLFTTHWTLSSAALPRYEPDTNGGPVGKVSEPAESLRSC